MQTLITAAQMRETDAHTIQTEPITSLKLMERAAKAFVKLFCKEVTEQSARIAVVCGQGNNGGDGLAIARLLRKAAYQHVQVYLIDFGGKWSKDTEANLSKLIKKKITPITVYQDSEFDLKENIVIDAVFGSGLNRPLTAAYELFFAKINAVAKKIIAVDVPSGFPAEGEIESPYRGITADLAISFQRPKLNYCFPESLFAVKRFQVVDIGLSESFIETQQSDWLLTEQKDILKLIKPRAKFSHKGTFGHALLLAGHANMMGAALLCASSCLHSGAGLTTLCCPKSGLTALNTVLPEVMALPRTAALGMGFEKFTAIGIGPGLGIAAEEVEYVKKIIALGKPMVIDADGLTMLSKKKELLAQLPFNTILTPHLKEFDRLFGAHETWWQRLATAKRESVNRNLIIVLKNQYTFVCLPNGTVNINPTGNASMASGGMGDVLTGMITAFLAQAYAPADAAILAVYLHGAAGDQLAKKYAIVTASQVAKQIPKLWRKMGKK